MIFGKRARGNVTDLVEKLRHLAGAHIAVTHYPCCACAVCKTHRTGRGGTIDIAAYKTAELLQMYADDLEKELQ